MIKKLLFFLFIPVIFWGCSSSVDTTNLSPEERFNYSLGLFNDEDYEEALKEFQAIVLQFPGNAVVDDAQYYLALTRYKRSEYILAAYEFSKLIKNMSASEWVDEAQLMLAECYYNISPNYSLDQAYTKKAIEEYQAFIDFFPANPKVPEAEQKINELNEKLAHKEYNTAYIYEKLEYYKAALLSYDNVIETYHDTKYAPLAMYDKINLLIQRGRNEEALTETGKFLERYPKDPRTEEVERIKSSLENKLSAAK
ncbi:MAG TPA: outer membrane protein assembly factor BamD [Ignavibacteriaceae bacterium]|nr:outer membrane protein assembly factor BamD [Ignavibacteriaceae bacterium]